MDNPNPAPDFSAVRRVLAPAAIVVAVLATVATVALVAFFQILPALFTAALAFVSTIYGMAALAANREARRNGAEPPDTSRWEGGAVWAASGLLAVVFVYASVLQLVGARLVLSRYAAWHYPDALRWIVGAVELFAAVALLIPRIATIGAVTLLPIMLGAAYTLLFRGSSGLAVLPIVLLGLLLFVAWERSGTRRHLLESR